MRTFKWVLYAGLAVQILCCILAGVWYQERVVLPDQANYLFELLISDRGFAVFHYRFIAVFTQLLPWMGIRAGGSLDTVARLYSINVELFHLGCALACLALRRPRLALAVIVCHLLITTDTFFWSISELTLSISLLFPLAALLQRWKSAIPSGIAVAALTVIVAFGHSLVLFPFAFLIWMLWQQRSATKASLVFAVTCFVLTLILKAVFFTDTYDQGALQGVKKLVQTFPHYLDTASLREFLQRCTRAFLAIPLCLLYILIRNGRSQWIGSAALVIALAGYVLLVTVCYPDTMAARFYHENLFQPIAFFLAISLLLDEGDKGLLPAIRLALLPLILVFALYRINVRQGFFSDRLAWEARMIREFQGRKVIIPERSVPDWRYLLSWSSPYEFWLLSSLETGRAASIMITNNPEEALSRVGPERKAFLPAFGLFSYDHLSPQYFPFKDTVSSYVVLPAQ